MSGIRNKGITSEGAIRTKDSGYRSDDSAIGTKDGNYCGNDLSIAPVQRHSGSVAHTAEDDW